MEIWKEIEGYNGDYLISNQGRVKSLKKFKGNTELILKKMNNSKGYHIVGLSKGKSKTFEVHKLVAIYFLNHVPCGYDLVVNHKDFDKHNNCHDNLEIVPQRENTNLKHIEHSSKYTGVNWYKITGKWQSGIKINGKRKHLGYFDNEYDAHIAYEKALVNI